MGRKHLKRRVALLLAAAMCVACLPAINLRAYATSEEFFGGSGTADDPYIITTKAHLNNVRNHLSAYFRMDADIEFTEADFAEGGSFYNNGEGWVPIGNQYYHPFTGVFDGNGYAVEGLKIDIYAPSNGKIYAGLFGRIEGGAVKNLGIVDCSINASADSFSDAGGIVGYMSDGKIELCYNTGSVYSSHYAGGIAGLVQRGTISNCYNSGSVSGYDVGGIVGAAETHSSISDCNNAGTVWGCFAGGIGGNLDYSVEVTNCFNRETVTAMSRESATAYAGGISGSQGKLLSCYNTGSITADANSYYASIEAYAYAGGIIGSGGTVEDCYNTGAVMADATATPSNCYAYAYSGGIAGAGAAVQSCGNTGEVTTGTGTGHMDHYVYTYYAGGITGYSKRNIANCFNEGAVTAKGYYANNYAGGIIGFSSEGSTSNCYNTADVTATGRNVNAYGYAGGIVGCVNDSGNISSCYNIGKVKEEVSINYKVYAAGIAGMARNSSITDCYYLDTSSMGVNWGDDTATACTQKQMQEQATFQGFDFDTVWTMEGSEDYPFPALQGVSSDLADVILRIKIGQVPEKIVYWEGKDALDLAGGTIIAEMLNGNRQEIPIEDFMVTGFDNSIIGKQTLTVTYQGKTASFEVEIIKAFPIGDLDKDGEVTDWDGILLNRYLAGWKVDIADLSAMDIDGDGEITDWDGVLLDRYLAGWSINTGIGK